MRYKILFLTIILIISSIGTSNAENVIIAVLEQPAFCKEPNINLAVRVLFAKVDNKWVALDNAEVSKKYDYTKIIWTVAFDGRKIGRIKTSDPNKNIDYDWAYPRDRLLKVTKDSEIPKIRNFSRIFFSWCDKGPEYRPLVLVSQANFKDPETWKIFNPSKEYIDKLFPELKRIFKKIDLCPNDEPLLAPPLLYDYRTNDKPLLYDYRTKDLLLFKNYKNASEQKLISIGINPSITKCDPILRDNLFPYWFVVDNSIRLIGTELALIDAGDYDNDGKSEVIFWHSGYNKDGYTLFYNNFNNRVDYYWNYH